MTFHYGQWYPLATGPASKPLADKTIEVLLTAKGYPRAIGCIIDLGDEKKAVAGGYHGFEWTHWSPLPPIFEGEEVEVDGLVEENARLLEEVLGLRIEVNQAAATTVYEIPGHHRWGSDEDRARAQKERDDGLV